MILPILHCGGETEECSAVVKFRLATHVRKWHRWRPYFSIRPRMIILLKNLYNGCGKVKVNNTLFKYFSPKCGVRQGCIVYTLLYIQGVQEVLHENKFSSSYKFFVYLASCRIYRASKM